MNSLSVRKYYSTAQSGSECETGSLDNAVHLWKTFGDRSSWIHFDMTLIMTKSSALHAARERGRRHSRLSRLGAQTCWRQCE